MPHRSHVCEIIPARAARASLPTAPLVRSGEVWQRFSQENRYSVGGIGYPWLTDTHDSCCFRGTLPTPLPGLDRLQKVSTRAHWCRLMSCYASKSLRQQSLRAQQTNAKGVLCVGRCDALRGSLAADTLCVSPTSAKVMFERLFAHQNGEQPCLQPPTTPCPTCVHPSSPRLCASPPGPSAGGGKKGTDPHSSSADVWCGTPRPPWIHGPERTAAQLHKTRRLKKHARRPFFEGEGPPRVSKAGRVTGPQPAPTTVDPNTVEEVPVSHTLARPAPQFTTLSGIGLVTFSQISAPQVIR